MQAGEGLHLVNLLAANFLGTRVYDRELLEEYAGADLPWSTSDTVARTGVEYRNDLLGHVHALGPHAPPATYHTGHEGSDQPFDWPPNKAACDELRALGATIGYAHPSHSTFPDGDLDAFFATARSVEARELVADAALGVVDSVDVLSPFEDEGAIYLYHRLLSCGLRLAATAGSDVFLSFRHGPNVASNPPGWCRVYAQLGDAPLSVAAFQDAVRAGRTVVTNGPWLTFTVDGEGPGAVLDGSPGRRLRVRADRAGRGRADARRARRGAGHRRRLRRRLRPRRRRSGRRSGRPSIPRSWWTLRPGSRRWPGAARTRSAPTTGCWHTRRPSTSMSPAGGSPAPPTPPGASGSSTGSRPSPPRTAPSTGGRGTGSSATWSR